MPLPAPDEITPDIIALCKELVADPKPIFIRVTPKPNAKSLDCFHTVTRYAEQHGGSICYGWQIWRIPDFMVEAEFHAVWRDPNGELHDITPKQLPINRILFLPDPERRYDGRQVNNIRRPLREDPRIKAFFELADKEFELLNRGQRAYQSGAISLTGDEAAELQSIQVRKNRLEMEIIQPILPMLEQQMRNIPPPGRNYPCPCGSGKKFKKCCGR